MAALAILLLPTVAFAASPWTTQTTYGGKVMGKLDFGFKNALGGWTEIITQPKNHHKGAKDLLMGVGQGLANAVVYTVGGVLHLVTFPITNLDVPLPGNGVNLS